MERWEERGISKSNDRSKRKKMREKKEGEGCRALSFKAPAYNPTALLREQSPGEHYSHRSQNHCETYEYSKVNAQAAHTCRAEQELPCRIVGVADWV